jgi:hypothetical protein
MAAFLCISPRDAGFYATKGRPAMACDSLLVDFSLQGRATLVHPTHECLKNDYAEVQKNTAG